MLIHITTCPPHLYISDPVPSYQTTAKRKMDEQQIQESSEGNNGRGSTVFYGTIASLLIGGPLLAMMGFALLVSTTLLVVASPLMLLFSPILLPAVFVIVGAMAGFGFAAAMAFGGFLALTWAFRYIVGGRGPAVVERIVEKMTGSSGEKATELSGYLKEKGKEILPENRVNGELIF